MRSCHSGFLLRSDEDKVGDKDQERITEKGIVANGVEYELDCIVYATGFEVGTSYTRRAGYELYGRGGLTLDPPRQEAREEEDREPDEPAAPPIRRSGGHGGSIGAFSQPRRAAPREPRSGAGEIAEGPATVFH